MDVLKSALMLSLDSLVAAAALGPLIGRGPARLRLALLFGACDTAASLAAWALGIAPAHWLATMAPGSLALFGLYLLTAGKVAGRRLLPLCLVPMLVSLDNLLSPAPPCDALVFGAMSAALAYVGLTIGAAAGRPIARTRWIGAGALAASALVLLS